MSTYFWSRSADRRADHQYQLIDSKSEKWSKPIDGPWARADPRDTESEIDRHTNPVYVTAHAGDSGFDVVIRTGPVTAVRVGVDGADFARINAANYHFRSALAANPETKSLVLLSCSPGAHPVGASASFADHLHSSAGVDKDVFAAAFDVITDSSLPAPKFLRVSRLGVLAPDDWEGGVWRYHPAADRAEPP
ncbi:hypothetical protein AB0M34_10690 [Nocardia sp. NPDC050193]